MNELILSPENPASTKHSALLFYRIGDGNKLVINDEFPRVTDELTPTRTAYWHNWTTLTLADLLFKLPMVAGAEKSSGFPISIMNNLLICVEYWNKKAGSSRFPWGKNHCGKYS